LLSQEKEDAVLREPSSASEEGVVASQGRVSRGRRKEGKEHESELALSRLTSSALSVVG